MFKLSIRNIQQLSFVVMAALFCAAFFAFAQTAYAKDTYQYYWLTKEKKAEIKTLFKLNYLPIRFKYKKNDKGSEWILKEYGKEQLIDFKIRVRNKAIESIDVIEYREPYGGEISQSRFRAQFVGVVLHPVKQTFKLSKHIDGISGATISVHSTERVAKLALFLDSQLHAKNTQP